MNAILPADTESACAGQWSTSHPRKGVTIDRLIAARDFFREHPQGKIRTGLWEDPEWTRERFHRWFLRCLHAKINRETDNAERFSSRYGRKHSPDYQRDLKRDAQIINDRARRIVRAGRNLLATPEMRRKYPHINNCKLED